MGAIGQHGEVGSAAFSVRRLVEALADWVRGDKPPGSAEVSEVAQEVQAVLMAQMEGNLGHVVLWEQFLRTPEEVVDAVVGVVQELVRRDPVLASWLRAAWARWHARSQAGGAPAEEIGP